MTNIRSKLAFLVLFTVTFVLSSGTEAKSPATKPVLIDPAASTLTWIGRKVTGEHTGTVRLRTGRVLVEKDKLVGGEIEIDMTTIENDDLQDPQYKMKLVTHLKSPDFFYVEKYPTAKFSITSAKPLPTGAAGTHQINGKMTIKGISRPISFPAVIQISGSKAEARAILNLDRTLWDIRYGSGKFFKGLGDKLIDDQFTINLHVVGNL